MAETMIFARRALAFLAALMAAAPAACQSAPRQTPAVIAPADENNLAALRTGLARALGRAQIELGPGDPTLTPHVSVLPAPLGRHETRSMAMPAQFDLFLRGEVCFAVQSDTGDAFPLEGVRCRPL